jgi:hypothetical protein
MATHARNFMARLAFTVALLTAGQAVAAEDDLVALVLHVDNYARIPSAHLARAEAVVTRIYAASGVRVVWVNGDAPAETAPGHLRVLLLCADMSAHKVRLDNVPDNVLGQAAKGAGRAHIFTIRVRDLAIARAQDFDLVLGRVMAHEVGHLLLPSRSHSAAGIMRESLDLGTRRFETFTPAQGSELQRALR